VGRLERAGGRSLVRASAERFRVERTSGFDESLTGL
jgi:hypothetical protein